MLKFMNFTYICITIQNVTTSEDFVHTEMSITTTDVDGVNVCSLSFTASDMQSKRMNHNDRDKSWIVNLLHV